MDFLRILRSLEELVYELMSILYFYPRTLWQVLVRPLQMARYAQSEQQDRLEERYVDAVSPPLLLMLTVLLAHLVEIAVRVKLPPVGTAVGQLIYGTEQNLLLYRALLFSLLPLEAAIGVVRRRGQKVDRETLRGPFHVQCFLATPLVLSFLLAGVLLARAQGSSVVAGAAVGIVGVVWYLSVQTSWLRESQQLSKGGALRAALGGFLRATFFMSLAALIVLGLTCGTHCEV
jgi:hypothetical protein